MSVISLSLSLSLYLSISLLLPPSPLFERVLLCVICSNEEKPLSPSAVPLSTTHFAPSPTAGCPPASATVCRADTRTAGRQVVSFRAPLQRRSRGFVPAATPRPDCCCTHCAACLARDIRLWMQRQHTQAALSAQPVIASGALTFKHAYSIVDVCTCVIYTSYVGVISERWWAIEGPCSLLYKEGPGLVEVFRRLVVFQRSKDLVRGRVLVEESLHHHRAAEVDVVRQ